MRLLGPIDSAVAEVIEDEDLNPPGRRQSGGEDHAHLPFLEDAKQDLH